jgi:hypothetical protein
LRGRARLGPSATGGWALTVEGPAGAVTGGPDLTGRA